MNPLNVRLFLYTEGYFYFYFPVLFVAVSLACLTWAFVLSFIMLSIYLSMLYENCSRFLGQTITHQNGVKSVIRYRMDPKQESKDLCGPKIVASWSGWLSWPCVTAY